MAIQTELYTHHVITHPGTTMKASAMLNDRGSGTFTLMNGDEPIFTADVARADSIDELLRDIIKVRDMMRLNAVDLLVGPAAPEDVDEPASEHNQD